MLFTRKNESKENDTQRKHTVTLNTAVLGRSAGDEGGTACAGRYLLPLLGRGL